MALLEHIAVSPDEVRVLGGSEPDPDQHAALTRAVLHTANAWATGCNLGGVQSIASFDATGGALFDFSQETSLFCRVSHATGWWISEEDRREDPLGTWFHTHFRRDGYPGELPRIVSLTSSVYNLTQLPGLRSLAARSATVGSWKDLAVGAIPLEKSRLAGFYALARILFSQNVAEGRVLLVAEKGTAWMARTPDKMTLLAVFAGKADPAKSSRIAHWFDLVALGITSPSLFFSEGGER